VAEGGGGGSALGMSSLCGGPWLWGEVLRAWGVEGSVPSNLVFASRSVGESCVGLRIGITAWVELPLSDRF